MPDLARRQVCSAWVLAVGRVFQRANPWHRVRKRRHRQSETPSRPVLSIYQSWRSGLMAPASNSTSAPIILFTINAFSPILLTWLNSEQSA